MLPDHRRQLVAIELRHHHVNQHDGDFLPQQAFECFGRRAHLDQVLPELAEDGLVGEQLRRLVIDQQDVDRILSRHSGHEPSTFAPCPFTFAL
jgi:hypothetical protein